MRPFGVSRQSPRREAETAAGMQRCARCRVVKPFAAFETTSRGWNSWCGDCRKARHAEHREAARRWRTSDAYAPGNALPPCHGCGRPGEGTNAVSDPVREGKRLYLCAACHDEIRPSLTRLGLF